MEKHTYLQPTIELIKVDNEISVVLMSSPTDPYPHSGPPTLPGAPVQG